MANTEKEWKHFEHNLHQWDSFKSWNHFTVMQVELADNKKQKKQLKTNLIAEAKREHFPPQARKQIIEYIKNHL